MLSKRKYPIGLINLIPIFLIFRLTHALVPDCKVYANGLVLDCANMDAFPEGSYESVIIAKLSRNNFKKLPPYVFAMHGFHEAQQAILRHSNIQIIQANAFEKMHSLEYLDLYNNTLSKLDPTTFEGLTSLKHLVLGQNRIVAITAAILSPVPFLESLDLSFNNLTDVPVDFIKNTKVSSLKLRGNHVSFSVGEPILESGCLQTLTLRECNLESLPDVSFSKLENLTILDLSSNRLRFLEKKLFKPLSKLRLLNIAYNFIDVISAEIFPIPNYLENIRCDGNPLEETQNCSELIQENTFRDGRSTVYLNDENIFHSSSGVKSLSSASLSQNEAKALVPNDVRLAQNKQSEKEILQYWMVIGLSIGLIVLVIVGSLQAFYIASQSGKSSNNSVAPNELLSEQYQSMY